MTGPVAITTAEEMDRNTAASKRTSIVQRFRFLLHVDPRVPGHP